MGVYGPKCNIIQALGTYTTIFEAKVLAVIKCAEINLKNGTNINIISDSQALQKALCSNTVKS